MISINKYIFDLCDQELDLYFKVINTIRDDFYSILNKIKCVKNCGHVRIYAHRLVSKLSVLKENNTNIKFNNILQSMLNIDKQETDFKLYKVYINKLLNSSTINLF